MKPTRLLYYLSNYLPSNRSNLLREGCSFKDNLFAGEPHFGILRGLSAYF